MDEFMEFSLLQGWRKLQSDPLGDALPEDCGYYGLDRIGGEGIGWSVILYSAKSSDSGKEYPFIVEVGGSDQLRFVYCADFLSAVELISKYAAMVTAGLLTGILEDLEARLEGEREESRQLADRRWRERQANQAALKAKAKSSV